MNDARPIAALLSSVFSERPWVPYLDWLYRQNPEGHDVSTNEFQGPTCVGHYCVIPMAFGVGSRELPMALSLNTAVSRDVRMKGLFVRLAEETYRQAADRGITAVTGVANANSTHGFVNRLGFQLIAPLPVKIGVSPMMPHAFNTLDPARLGDAELARAIGSIPAETSKDWSPRWPMDKLLWRLRSPMGRYLVHVSPDAIAVSTLETRRNVRVAVVLKTFAQPGARAGPLLSAVCRAHRTPIYLHAGIGAVRIRGLPLPRALRPVPLNFIYRPLVPPAPDTLQIGHFEFLDFDAY